MIRNFILMIFKHFRVGTVEKQETQPSMFRPPSCYDGFELTAMWLIGGDGRLYSSLVSTARNTPIYQYPNFNASVFCATLGTIIVCGRLV